MRKKGINTQLQDKIRAKAITPVPKSHAAITPCSRSADNNMFHYHGPQIERTSRLQHHLLRLSRVALIRAIRALEPVTLGQLVERFSCNDVAARHHHGRVGVCSLFFGNRTDEDGVEMVGGGKGNFDLVNH